MTGRTTAEVRISPDFTKVAIRSRRPGQYRWLATDRADYADHEVADWLPLVLRDEDES
jgi:hypothetical protein